MFEITPVNASSSATLEQFPADDEGPQPQVQHLLIGTRPTKPRHVLYMACPRAK
jgi:hypothetical protein